MLLAVGFCPKKEVAYALSIGTEINDLGWPWTAETSLLRKWNRFTEPS